MSIANSLLDYDSMILFVVTLLTFLVIDITFISMFSGTLFDSMVNDIQGSPMSIRTGPAFLAYIVMTFALFFFVLNPIFKSKSN